MIWYPSFFKKKGHELTGSQDAAIGNSGKESRWEGSLLKKVVLLFFWFSVALLGVALTVISELIDPAYGWLEAIAGIYNWSWIIGLMWWLNESFVKATHRRSIYRKGLVILIIVAAFVMSINIADLIS